MSPDEKTNMREKRNHQMKRSRLHMSPDEKTNMGEKATHRMKRSRLHMSPDEKTNMREKACHWMKRLRRKMSPDEKTNMREIACHRMKRLRHSMSPDEKTEKKILRLSKKRKLSMSPGNDIHCMKEANKILHRTQESDNSHKHKSIVCVICDWFIIGTETIHYLSKDRMGEHSNRLSVKNYKRNYGIELKTEARNQYLINDGNLKYLLHSPQSRKTPKGYTTCSFCFSGM